MKKFILLTISAMLVALVATAQTLTIKTNSGSKQFSASDVTDSSPATFSNNGTRMTIGSNAFNIGDIISALVATENVGHVKDMCPDCDGSTLCQTCHGTGKGCTTCNGTGKYCSKCEGTGKHTACYGTGICPDCSYGECSKCEGSGNNSCSYCFGHGICTGGCGGTGTYLGRTCSTCKGSGKCPKCNGSGTTGKCTKCSGSGKCNYCGGSRQCSSCNGTGKCTYCGGNPRCYTCGGDGHCNKCNNSDGKCTNCSGKGYVWVDIKLSDTSLDLSYQGESKYLSITINQSWKATCSASWITLKNAEGRNSSNITVTADANTSENSRSATLIISYGGKSSYVSITQKGVPTLQLSKRQVDFEASPNASQTVSITCNRIWYASSDKDWVSVSPAYSEGSGYLTITATSNPTMDSRSATVTVRSEAGAETIDITQAAGEGIIEASLYKSDCSRDGDILLLQIKASDRREWTVLRSSNATWLHFDTNSNTSQIVSGTGDKYILLYADQSTDIYARSCQLTIMSGSYTKTITVTQNAAPMSLGWMLTKPFGFIDLYFNTASFETIYNTLANQFDLTVYNNAYYVEVYKNPSLSGISCCGLPLGLFRAGFAYFDNKPQYSYIFEIDKSYISDITPYVKAILNEFSAIGVKLTYRSYSDYYVYYAYYDNIHIDFYVKTFSDGYQLNIEFSYK